MQLLKSLVIGMGLVILVGLALLAYSIIRKADDPAWRPFAQPPLAPAAAPGRDTGTAGPAFGELALRLPEGCVIESVRPDGARAYLTIGPGPACNRVVIVDVGDGRVLGTVKPGP